MTFFNKKEDVLKIELTPHGRKLLSMGKLKPYCYAFLDDDILYDISRGGATETNLQTKNRILSDTPYMKPQTNYRGIDSNKSNNEEKKEQAVYMQQKIGSNNTAQSRAASWNITTLLGEIEKTSNSLTGSTLTTQPIPQLDFELNYTMSVENIAELELSEQGLIFNRDLPSDIKEDGSFVDIVSEQILLNMFERNGFFHKNSYELEVYMYEKDEINLQKKLKFFDQDRQIKNNMLLEEEEITDDITKDYVEYYIDIQTDTDIPQEDICSGIRRLKAKDIFLDIDVECPDRDDLNINIYSSRVRPEDLEDC